MRSFTTLAIAAMLATGSMTGAMAQTLTETNSLEVVTGGPYTSTSGYTDSSIYITSSAAYPNNESYGLLDFSGFTAPANPAGISGLTVSLSQYTNSHAAGGPLDFFISSNVTPVTDSNKAGYAYDTGSTDGIAPSLGPVLLGSANYVVGGKSTPSSYTFSLSNAASTALQNSFAAGDLKVLIGTGANSTTEAQFDGVYYSPATVTFAAGAPVPEASTTAGFGFLLVLGLGGVAIARRRKRA